MMNQKRRAEMARKIETMTRFRALAGATVLEIGADKDSISAGMLCDAGAARVISTNFDPDWPHDVRGAVERRPLDARLIGESCEARSLDVIFGVAVLEHIDGLGAFFAGVRRALKPGGLLFVHGGPIWSSAIGHHLKLDCGPRAYRFSDAKHNPVRSWTHLFLSKDQMTADLAARVPAEDAQAIASAIYDTPDQNRQGYRAINDAFAASGLSLVERFDNAFNPPPPDVREAIERGPYGGQERYDVTGVTFVARP